LLGEFFKTSVAWRSVQRTEVRRDLNERGEVSLILTTRAGQRYEFSTPPGLGADALYAIHQQYKTRNTY